MRGDEPNAYILGTDHDELHRLGLQHEIWSAEASRGWEIAGFCTGQTLLDLGCGPGFCTQELAYVVGATGRVIGVDKSESYIDFARRAGELHRLPVEFQVASYDDMVLEDESLDGAYSRWALAWVPNPQEVVTKVVDALRPGGVFVAHEYHDWSTFRVSPARPALDEAIAAAYESFAAAEGDINVGRRMPSLFAEAGLEVVAHRSMSRLALPGTLSWYWPDSFLENYLPRLVEAGKLDEATRVQAMADWRELGGLPETVALCPTMVEVIGLKPGS